MTMKIPFFNKIIIFIILGVRPLFGIAHCRYAVSCTKFAVWQLEQKGLCAALWEIGKRVVSCNPLL
jgi:putative component of membrane protein insertase Oxa1/YidC/SpoIIIJ protein YidD